MRILAHIDHDRRKALHARLRASNTAASPALARLRDSADDDELPIHVWALGGEEDTPVGATAEKMKDLNLSKHGLTQSEPLPPTTKATEPSASASASAPPAPAPALHAVPPLADELLGGLVGHTWARWLHVTYLFVAPAERGAGLGRTLLEHAERLARERGCVAAIVQTWDFQAPQFYLANGYEVAGKVEGYPPGITDYTLIKRFSDVDRAAVRVGNKRVSLGVTDV